MTVRSIWTKYQYALPIAILAIGAIFGVIYALKGTVLTTWQIKLGIAMFVEYAVFAFIAAILARRIKSSLGASYSKAVNWLIAALFMTSFSSMHELLSILFLPVPWAPYATYLHWTYLVAAIFFAYTGQLFNSIDATSRNLARDTGYIEAIIGVAGLASKVEEIDPLLDELRQVTARMPQGTRELSADDKRILLRLYYKLERYLTAKDPLRTFTQEDVRSHLTYDFRKMLDQPDGSSPLGVS